MIDDLVGALERSGVTRGDLVGLTIAPGIGMGVAVADGQHVFDDELDIDAMVAAAELAIGPRWAWWSNATASHLVEAGVRVAMCWDIAAAHRLLVGGWHADAGRAWACAAGLDAHATPTLAPPNLFTSADDDGDEHDPVRPDGFLRPEWVDGGWANQIDRLGPWSALALTTARRQLDRLASVAPRAPATARSESAAELLCAELTAQGLPMDRRTAEGIVERYVGPRPSNLADAAKHRSERDRAVLQHVLGAGDVDLRSPGQVRELLRRVGIEVPDTRAWRLRALADAHPLVPALLEWRKAERVATTYGYGWLDEHLGHDGRLRGAWAGSDGAAGRMTASNGLHNMPAEMRPAVMAEPGHTFIRADLGQIEPRVLAAVSGDAALARATQADDLYAPVAAQLSIDRATAKVAVLGAMYGQTTGTGARALTGLESTYPVAMGYLRTGARSGEEGRDLRTYGGRLIPMGSTDGPEEEWRVSQARAAARGRYGRNALVQGAAAELFKLWAVTVRARGVDLDAQIVLCLHDELLVHAPDHRAEAAVELLETCLQEAVRRWAPDGSVRFLAEIAIVRQWSDAKEAPLPES